MRIIKSFLLFVLGVTISYILFYNVTSELLSVFYQGSIRYEHTVYYLVFFGQTLTIIAIIKLLCQKKINKVNIILLWILYFALMVVLLFGREYMGSTFNFDISQMFNFYYMNVLQIFMNYFMFLPIGYLLRSLTFPRMIVMSIMIIMSIELTQGFTHRGLFDVTDIVINTLSIISGYYLSCLRMLILEKKNDSST